MYRVVPLIDADSKANDPSPTKGRQDEGDCNAPLSAVHRIGKHEVAGKHDHDGLNHHDATQQHEEAWILGNAFDYVDIYQPKEKETLENAITRSRSYHAPP